MEEGKSNTKDDKCTCSFHSGGEPNGVCECKRNCEDFDEFRNDQENELEPCSAGIKDITSEALLYFDVVNVKGVRMAKCKSCEVLFYPRIGVNTRLLKHAKETCPKRDLNLVAGQSQSKVKIEDNESATLAPEENHVFDQQASRRALVDMVVLHEYPLSIVEHIGFRKFSKTLNANFKMISRKTLRSDVLKLYNNEMSSLKVLLERNEGRVAITTDMWGVSNQKKRYMAVTAHYVDQNWVLHDRILRFCYVPYPYTEEIIAEILMDSLSRYTLENKISTVVLDNCTSNDDALMNVLMDKLETSCLMLGGDFLHMRCSAHILNLIVKDGLEVIEPAIGKVQECVAFWMSTPKRIEKFEQSCRLMKMAKSQRLVLGCKDGWNSTYLMLKSSLPFKDVFNKLQHLNRRLKFVVPSDDDWTMATLVCQNLEVFYKATKVFSSKNHPTSNMFFRRICQIKLALDSWVKSDDNEVIKTMAKSMVEKFDMYWAHTNRIMAIVAILDPRNKMDCVAFYFEKLYGDGANGELAKVRKTLDDLFKEYQNKTKLVNEKTPEGKEYSYEDDFARTKRQKLEILPTKSEVNLYLESAIWPEDDEFDVLEWWKRDQNYPILRKIAKDVLAIPASSIDSKSAFSMGGRTISVHRSRLHSQTMEALMCLRSWMVDDLKGTSEEMDAYSTVNEDCDDDVEEMDFLDIDVDDV